MTLEEEFKNQHGYNAYEQNNLRPEVPNDFYVEWLEHKVEFLRSINKTLMNSSLNQNATNKITE
ncbi:hypothetical protein AAU57_12045 [Nonlabens sp. YIK11]|uniref:hypothetical protein n=1 Tax=Nonlabens sp. YIK11 TaxID=1453349 RepID=UPI0006DBD8A9|nr:hypothetical protein [Nonlabens sp. YIK11]KQC33979.1 hypothetical protein AAU57_12045 [Nonlabens sp. YIK11]